MANLKLFFVRIKVFIFHFASGLLKYYLLGLLIIATIILIFIPFSYWNTLPPCKEIEPNSFVIENSKSGDSNYLDLTINSNDKKTYICELSPVGLLRFYRDPLGNETIGYQYRVLAKDINNGGLISFPIHVIPPVSKEYNPYNSMFNDICIGGNDLIEYMRDNFRFYEPDISLDLRNGYVNEYWKNTYKNEKFPQFKVMVTTFNQKIVNASKLPYSVNEKFDFFNYLSTTFANATSIILYAFFLWRVIGQNNNRFLKIFKLSKSTKKFTDVAGIEEEKSEISEIVDYLKNPNKYETIGAKFPHGILLYGPPGTGKTLLAKAVAGEANVPFFAVSASSFDEKYVGVGASRIRLLFSMANFFSPSIIFIDEIDGIVGRETSNHQTINELLTQMDGFDTKKGVIIIAASNRISDLDAALLRPGRFDRKIKVDLPNFNERKAILEVHGKNKNLSSKINLSEVAKKTFGFSGAELENILNEAVILALRAAKNKKEEIVIKPNHLSEAIDRIIMGIAKYKTKYDKKVKKIVAVHEVGHALVGLYVKEKELVDKITIIPHGDAAGYTYVLPQDLDSPIKTKKMLLDDIIISLAGRAAEFIFFGKDMISTGANNDLQKATVVASEIVAKHGMSDVGMTQFISHNNLKKTYSNEIAFKIDKEIEKIIQTQYQNAIKIIKSNKKEFGLFVEALIKYETLLKDDIYYIHKNKKLPQK